MTKEENACVLVVKRNGKVKTYAKGPVTVHMLNVDDFRPDDPLLRIRSMEGFEVLVALAKVRNYVQFTQ